MATTRKRNIDESEGSKTGSLISDARKESKKVHAPLMNNMMHTKSTNVLKHSTPDACLEPGSPLFKFACSKMEDPQRKSIFFQLTDDQKVRYGKFVYEKDEAPETLEKLRRSSPKMVGGAFDKDEVLKAHVRNRAGGISGVPPTQPPRFKVVHKGLSSQPKRAAPSSTEVLLQPPTGLTQGGLPDSQLLDQLSAKRRCAGKEPIHSGDGPVSPVGFRSSSGQFDDQVDPFPKPSILGPVDDQRRYLILNAASKLDLEGDRDICSALGANLVDETHDDFFRFGVKFINCMRLVRQHVEREAVASKAIQERDEAKAQVEALTGELSSKDDRIAKLQDRLKEGKKVNTSLAEKLKEVRQSKGEMEARFQKKVGRLEGEVEQLRADLKAVKEEIAGVDAKLTSSYDYGVEDVLRHFEHVVREAGLGKHWARLLSDYEELD